MSKALFGHLGGPDPRLLAEVGRLRARVAELEAENESLRAQVLIEGATLGEVTIEPAITLDQPAPALA